MTIATMLILAAITGCDCSCHQSQVPPRRQMAPAKTDLQAYWPPARSPQQLEQDRREMDAYYARERDRARSRIDAINAEYYQRTGTKPAPYWDMPY